MCASKLSGLVDLAENKAPEVLPRNWSPKKREGKLKGHTRVINTPNLKF